MGAEDRPQASRFASVRRTSHCAEAEYAAILTMLNIHGAYRRQRLVARQRFVAAYPDLTDWFREPLERTGWATGRRAARRGLPPHVL